MRRGRRSTSRQRARSDAPIPRRELEQLRRLQDIRDRELVIAKLSDPFEQWRRSFAVERSSAPRRRSDGLMTTAVRRGSAPFERGRNLTSFINPETYLEQLELETRKGLNQVDRDCRRAKDDRRGSVISSGNGGRNGARKYKPHSEC